VNLTITNDGSVEDSQGKVLFFGLERFIEQIVKGSNCFICGAGPEDVVFNDEHVIPDWLLRRFQLQSRTLTIPNETSTKYQHLKVPCCEGCNSKLGETFESPLREMFQLGYAGFTETVRQKGTSFLFEWLALIFLKMHLKDKQTRMFRDLRMGDSKIADMYDWEELHHVHCLCRRFYTGLQADETVAGSLLVLPAKTAPHIENFDFIDLHLSQTMLLRVDDIAVIATLNDHGAGGTVLKERLRQIGGPLSPLQIRELVASLAYVNLNLYPRPQFKTEFDQLTGQGCITGEKPYYFNLPAFDTEMYGNLLYRMCEDLLSSHLSEKSIADIRSGKWTFLTNADGTFAHDNFDLEAE
jgi:hypothetical protein